MGAQDVFLSISRGGKLIVKVPENVENLSTSGCEQFCSTRKTRDKVLAYLSELILSILSRIVTRRY